MIAPAALNFADATPLMCAGLTVYYGLSNAGFGRATGSP
jgi:hypothetical protein